MAKKKVWKVPRTLSSLRIEAAAKRLKKMPMADKIQLMVGAGLMTQDEADAAKRKVAEDEARKQAEAATPAT